MNQYLCYVVVSVNKMIIKRALNRGDGEIGGSEYFEIVQDTKWINEEKIRE